MPDPREWIRLQAKGAADKAAGAAQGGSNPLQGAGSDTKSFLDQAKNTAGKITGVRLLLGRNSCRILHALHIPISEDTALCCTRAIATCAWTSQCVFVLCMQLSRRDLAWCAGRQQGHR